MAKEIRRAGHRRAYAEPPMVRAEFDHGWNPTPASTRAVAGALVSSLGLVMAFGAFIWILISLVAVLVPVLTGIIGLVVGVLLAIAGSKLMGERI